MIVLFTGVPQEIAVIFQECKVQIPEEVSMLVFYKKFLGRIPVYNLQERRHLGPSGVAGPSFCFCFWRGVYFGFRFRIRISVSTGGRGRGSFFCFI